MQKAVHEQESDRLDRLMVLENATIAYVRATQKLQEELAKIGKEVFSIERGSYIDQLVNEELAAKDAFYEIAVEITEKV